MIRETVIVLLAVYATVSNASQVADCKTGRFFDDQNFVRISSCETPPCQLKRKSEVKIDLEFMPEKDINSLVTTVNAAILGLPVPFIGVNGVNACDSIYHEDGTKANCPLAKGTKYVYKSSFPVLQVYPRITTVVHWALTEAGKDIACFEVPAKIV